MNVGQEIARLEAERAGILKQVADLYKRVKPIRDALASLRREKGAEQRVARGTVSKVSQIANLHRSLPHISAAIKGGETVKEVSERFGVSGSSIRRYCRDELRAVYEQQRREHLLGKLHGNRVP